MLNSDIYNGKFTMGGYDLKYAKQGKRESDVFWMPLAKNYFYWTVRMGTVGFKTKLGVNKLSITADAAIMDTGMSLAFIPPKDFEEIKNSLEAGRAFKMHLLQEHNLWMVDCSYSKCKDLPDLLLEFKSDHSGKLFKLPASKYLVLNDPWTREYIFALQPSPLTLQVPGSKEKDKPYWILGDAFLSEYYSIYDYPRQRIGLIETSTTQGSVAWSKVWALVAMALLVSFIGSCFFCCFCCLCWPCRKGRGIGLWKKQ